VSEYAGYDIKQLWLMVDAARQGLQPSHDQVAALNKAQQMLGAHAQSLEEAREQLAAKWPPESNAASAAYLTELDRLIAAVKDTALSCAVNVFHINTVSDAIVQAHDTLAPLHAEYVKNEGALAQYEADIKSFGDGASLIPGGSTIATGAAKLFTSPPVDDGRQDQLTSQAQQAMVPLAGAAQDGTTYIKPPTPYVPPTVNGDPIQGMTDFGGSAGGSSSGDSLPPPVIDPPAHQRAGSGNGTATGPTSEAKTPPSTSDPGPFLSGNTRMPVAPTPSIVPTIEPGSPGPNIIGGGSLSPPPGVTSGLGGSPTRLGKPTGGFGGRLPGVAPEKAGLGRGPFGNTGTPRGGIIGSVPGGTNGGRPVPSRVNPPGGVIGQQRAGGGRGTTTGAGNRAAGRNGMGTIGALAGRNARETDQAGGQRWDPDNPWEVDEGVEPVIMPDAPERIDPGPGIIGMDR
jgi:hypothetical protein